MKKPEQYKRTLNGASALINTALLGAAFAIIWYTCYSQQIVLPFYRKGNWMVIGIYIVITVIFNQVYGSYKVGYLRKSEAFYSQIISVFAVNIIEYCQISVIGRDFIHFMPMVFLTLVDIIIVLLWTLIYSFIYRKLYPPRRMIIVYGSRNAGNLVMKMSRRDDKYIISESVKSDEDIEVIREKILSYDGVILYDVPDRMRNDILKFCFDRSLRVYMAPKISDIIIRGAQEINLFDTPLLLCRNDGLPIEKRAAKRLFDLIFSIVLLPVLLPLMLIIMIAIKLDDGGPVIYKQERLTTNGKRFFVLKFRSMITDAEKDGVARLATDSDSRITRVGAFLRKCRLDELPQIFNIIKGDMSFVGPRPERPEIAAEYEKDMAEFSFRLVVKAGLTGYAQIMGKYDTTPYDKLKMDLMYIEKYSLLNDMKLILMTVKTMIFPGETNETENVINISGGKPEE
ncbi:MAG: exopolysaccharide biosynthesis polyprenyl glycosylphosphotransferase [Ruminococcus sp.]|nr:exopolysaccharide biosynthesis polyprenyl glycosylphosphotransferase [Ruminococcus sp.]